MLRIRNEQLDAFRARDRDRFRQQVCERVAVDHPELQVELGADGVSEFVDAALARLDQWRIDTVGAASILIELMINAGERFERSPDQAALLELLAHPTLPGSLKAELVFDTVNQKTQGRTVSVIE